ncbi:BTB/POZ protein [Rhizophagus clarus]|uniref:BTB/POZ protein n=1 Tax=Rhizophagus clarus TaxID=94130 RepID=A0A8H3LDE4_9GLOM|nr:BTB/POZ protein [Rhizophagus clarus]
MIVFLEALKTGELHDTEIVVGEEPNTKTFLLHSLLLRLHSPYFLTALSDRWTKIENKIIKLRKPNISVEVFDIIINYIYSGTLNLSKNFITNVDLLIAADELLLEDLCSCIIENIVEKLQDKEYLSRNFASIQDATTKMDHFPRLSQSYKDAFQQDPSLIFKADDFVTVNQDFLLDLLNKNSHSLKPIEVWGKLMDWCRARSVELNQDVKHWTINNALTFRDLVHPYIQHIDFRNISPTDFSRKVRPYKDILNDASYILDHYSFNNYSNFKSTINSKIINSEHADFLSVVIKTMNNDAHNTLYEFNLLIRGTDNENNGFRRDSFYNSCEEKGPTITLARVKNTNEILGGFNSSKWKSYGMTIGNRENFIFSLDNDNLKNSIFSKVEDVKTVLRNVNNFIPDFGDLYFQIDTKKGSYRKNSYEKLIRRDEGQFEIDDYEVFQVNRIL